MKKLKKVYLITPIYIKYNKTLNDSEYKAEIKAVKKEILKGAREWAFSTTLREGISKITE